MYPHWSRNWPVSVSGRIHYCIASWNPRAKRPRNAFTPAFALLPVDQEQVEFLYSRLLVAGPAELLVLRDALRPFRERLIGRLWKVLEQSDDKSQYLQAASALALYDQSNPRWQNVGSKVAQAMVKVDAVYLGTWLDALRPARGELTDPLATIFRDKRHSETERSLAMSILIDYVSDRRAAG